jgi:hypothetical protein
MRNEMGGACNVWVRGEVHIRFWWGNLKEEEHLQDSGTDGRIILKCIFKKWDGKVDWTDLAQNRDRRQTLVNAVRNNFGCIICGEFLD